MATPEEVASVRRMAEDALTTEHTDEVLSGLVDSKGSAEAAASALWQEAAGRYSKLVSTSESGSSRSMQQIHANMLAMAKHYASIKPIDEVVVEVNYPFTTDIERV